MIRLSRSAPWNPNLRNSRIRYIQAGDRKFTADLEGGIWSVWECDETGHALGWRTLDIEAAFVALAFNQAQVRLAIQMRLDGKTEDEIRKAVHRAPRPGTGRNHPKHVARRRGWTA